MNGVGLKIPFNDPAVMHRLSHKIEMQLLTIPRERPIVIVCIGTDRSTGDALGPLVGTALSKESGKLFELYGTLEDPVHAMNLSETLLKIMRAFKQPFIIAIDACLGQISSVGCIQVGAGPVRPGAGVNKELPPVGDMHLTGIVNVGGFMEYFVLQNTRLNLVYKMSDIISRCMINAIRTTRNATTPYAWSE